MHSPILAFSNQEKNSSSSSSNSSSSTGTGDFLCSCCGKATPRAKKNRSIGRTHVAVAACVAHGLVRHLDSKFPLLACRSCFNVAIEAAKIARFCFPGCTYFKQQNGGAASEAEAAISSNGLSLRAALDFMLGGDASKMNIGNLPVDSCFALGAAVDVACRMGPGVNKPGGVATVTEATTKGGGTVYAVKYVHGGAEAGLTQDLLSPPQKSGKRRASSSSPPPGEHGGGASAESRKHADALRGLNEQLTAVREEVASVRWEAGKDRQTAATYKQLVKETAA